MPAGAPSRPVPQSGSGSNVPGMEGVPKQPEAGGDRTAVPAEAATRPGRPLLAALLSTLIPGVGQWYAGRRRQALILLAAVGAGLGFTIWLAVQDRLDLVRIFVQPHWLWLALFANVIVFAGRMYASVDSFLLENRLRPGPRPLGGWAGRAGLVVLALLIAAPHAVVAYYGYEALDLFNTVFDQSPLADQREELEALGITDFGPTTSLVESTSPTFTPATLPPDAYLLGKELIPYEDRFPDRPEIEPQETDIFGTPHLPLEDLLDKDRITVLLAGGDAGPKRFSLRTDVMIVATMNLETRKAVLFSISRDMIKPPLPAAWNSAFYGYQYELAVKEAKRNGEEPPESVASCHCFPDRMNAIYHWTQFWVDTFPDAVDPGMEALRQTLEVVMGLPIDYYVLVDMAGFVDLVDALGGIDVYATEIMDAGFSEAIEGEDPVTVTIEEPGWYHFDGRTALAYMRNRDNTNDAARMRRQRCTIRALAAQATPATIARRFPQIADALKNSTTTTVPLSLLPDLIEYAASLQAGDIATSVFGYPYHAPTLDFRSLPIIDVGRIQGTVRTMLEAVEVGTLDGGSIAAECEVEE